jgi:PhzF family phenazine biosynthesis protein
MAIPLIQVDAFTNRAFAGNPAAVCILPGAAEEHWMADVAREMNLSETAFLHRVADGFGLRWFTPAVEVDLCGHATLASAHVLWETGQVQAHEAARFHTRSGLLTAVLQGDWIEMDFPAKPQQPAQAPDGLLNALGAVPAYVGRNQFDYLVELDSEDKLRTLRPNFSKLAELPVRGVIVTSRSAEYDFVCRFFAPGSGIQEDPVTGSAYCCLGPYWAPKLNKREFLAYQASARGGVVRVRLEGDRVKLGGQAVTVLRGELVG